MLADVSLVDVSTCMQSQVSGFYLATMGVSPSVIGARTGKSALLHRKASAMDELGPERRLLNQPRSCGFASSLTCWSADVQQVKDLSDYACEE